MEISRIYSKVHGIFNKFVEFSKYWINFCGIFQKTMNFSENLQILKKTQGFFQKKLKDLKKTQSFGGNVPQVASQKLGKKRPCHNATSKIVSSTASVGQLIQSSISFFL